MKISFDSSCKRFNFPFRVIGNAGRYDTISDCEFLDDTHIICADRQMAKLYLINFDISSNKHTILDSIECICNNKQQNIELIYIHNKNTIYAVSYTSYLFSCEIVNNKFCNLKTILINVKEAYHGLCRSENDSLYLTNTLKSNLTEFNLITGLKKNLFVTELLKLRMYALLMIIIY